MEHSSSRPKRALIYAAAGAFVFLLCTLPLFIVRNSEFGGADGAAGELVEEISPGYTPWIESFWSPPGAETESLLFCLQAALGSGVFFYCAGYFAARKKYGGGGKRNAGRVA
jgi:cobalt/nickel transport protein